MTVKVVCFDRLLQVLILKALRRELDPRGGVQTLGSDVRTVRGCMAANTRDNSTQVYWMSITFLLAFEWNRKSLKLLTVKVKFPALAQRARTGHPAGGVYGGGSGQGGAASPPPKMKRWIVYSCLHDG